MAYEDDGGKWRREREKEDKSMMREWERDKDREMGEG